jgi:hypothetical protein
MTASRVSDAPGNGCANTASFDFRKLLAGGMAIPSFLPSWESRVRLRLPSNQILIAVFHSRKSDQKPRDFR